MPSFRLRNRGFSISSPFKKDNKNTGIGKQEERSSFEKKHETENGNGPETFKKPQRAGTLKIASLISDEEKKDLASSENAEHLRVIIIGCGLGGLATAIACRKRGVNVTLLERTANLEQPNAGIEIPPNAARILRYFGVHKELHLEGAVLLDDYCFRRYSDGSEIGSRFPRDDMVKRYGNPWVVVSRADYQKVLMQKALEVGAYIGRAAEVVEIDDSVNPYNVILKDGRRLIADVVVGADGPHSKLRDHVVDEPYPVEPTGQTVFHATFPMQELRDLKKPEVDYLISRPRKTLWLGPAKHVVFYPLRQDEEFSMVVWTPNDPSREGASAEDRLEELKAAIEGWDPVLATLISCLKDVSRKKIHDHAMLDSWVKSPIVLVGEAGHPSLPYQTQGAAMSVEDGAVLGALLGKLDRSGRFGSCSHGRDVVSSVLGLYDSIRKPRTTQIVNAVQKARREYTLPDGEAQRERDTFLGDTGRPDWSGEAEWAMATRAFQKQILGLNVVADAEKKFDDWLSRSTLKAAMTSPTTR